MAIAPPRSSKSRRAPLIRAERLRPYQKRLVDARQRFNCWVCHRRFGKSALTLLITLSDLTRNAQRQPRYAYIAPLYRQAKAIAWDMLSRYASVFEDITINQAELRVDFPNGGQIRLYGADNPDSLRGIYLDGVVFDEYAQMRPRVWHEVVRPALADRAGWAIFIGTPMGHNHFYDLYQQAQHEPDWHTALYTVEDTGVIPQEELDAARRVMAPEQYAQEWMCSFESALIGAYYASYLETAREEGRITRVPWEVNIPVHVSFDIGVADSTAIWFFQPVGRMIHVIDYFEATDRGLEYYVRAIREKPYVYGRFYWPHDVMARDFSSDGRSRLALAESLGLKPSVIATQSPIADGVQAVRTLFPRFMFDKEKCHEGLLALAAYRREWSETRKTFLDHPMHDWSSHAADSLRTFCIMYQDQETVQLPTFTRDPGAIPRGVRQGFWFR
jgi:hypothetical protein